MASDGRRRSSTGQTAGGRKPIDRLIEAARSVIEVDQATWDAVPVDPSTDDGCNSMWC